MGGATGGAPSILIGSGPYFDYPAYLVKFTVTGGSHIGGTCGFWILDDNPGSGDAPVQEDTLRGSVSITGLLTAIKNELVNNGLDGGTVSSLTITKYSEASADVTP